MNRHTHCAGILAVCVTAAAAQTPAPAVPQTPGFASKPILAAPISGVDNKEITIINADGLRSIADGSEAL